MKKLATFTALAALAIAPALAQTTMPTPDSSARPATTSMTKAFLDAQTSDQWLASKLIGTSVVGAGNEKIGSVNDLVLDQNGAVLAAVVGVGGFLGIGEKNVAISFKSTNLVRTSDGDKVTLQVSKAELEQAPSFKPYVPPRPAAQQRPEGMKRIPGSQSQTN